MSPGKHNPINKKLAKEEVINLLKSNEPSKKEVAANRSIHSADKVIETNNLKSQAGLGGATQKLGGFFTKQAIKQGLKKYVGPMVSKAFGVTAAILTPTTAYAQTKDPKDFMSDSEAEAHFARKRRNERAKEKGIKTIMDPDY